MFDSHTVLYAANSLPPYSSYRIFGIGEDEEILQKVIQHCCPTGQFLGFIEPREIANFSGGSSLLVVCDPNWPDVLKKLTPNERL